MSISPFTKGLSRSSHKPSPMLPPKTLTSIEIKKVLLSFDLDPKFGPSYGLTRTARFLRAKKLGLNPPEEIPRFIELDCDDPIWSNHFC